MGYSPDIPGSSASAGNFAGVVPAMRPMRKVFSRPPLQPGYVLNASRRREFLKNCGLSLTI